MRDESVKSTCLSSLLVFWFSISEPRGGHFLFLAGVLTPPPFWPCPGPLAEAPCYLLFRELGVQRVNTVWLVEQGSNLLLARTQAHIHSRAQTRAHTQKSHDHPKGLAEMFPARQSLHTVELGDKQTQTSITPATIALLVISNSTTWNVKLWVWWQDRANTHKGYRMFTLTGCDSIHSGELSGLLVWLGNMSLGGLSCVSRWFNLTSALHDLDNWREIREPRQQKAFQQAHFSNILFQMCPEISA